MAHRVELYERETHVCYSMADVRSGGNAIISTFEPRLKTKALKAGGRVTRESKTVPQYWEIEVPAKLIRVGFKRQVSRRKRVEPRHGLQPTPVTP
jgi:predicted component of type VI protein secretion system